jgi:hypothetical protein
MPQLSLRNPPCLCGKNQPWLDEVRARFMSALPTELWLTEEDRKAP